MTAVSLLSDALARYEKALAELRAARDALIEAERAADAGDRQMAGAR